MSAQDATVSLEEREKEYKKLNEKLEAETAKLVQEADLVMRKQHDFLSHTDSNIEDKATNESQLLSIAAGAFDDDFQTSEILEKETKKPESSRSVKSNVSRPSSTRPLSARTQGQRPHSSKPQRPQSSRGQGSRPQSAQIKSSRPQSKKTTKSRPAADDVAIPDDFSATFAKSIHDLEKNRPTATTDDDVMPDVAMEMGTEAQIRFLKAKIRVYQEDFEESRAECRKAVEERNSLRSKLKQSEEEVEKMKKSSNIQQSVSQKLKSQLEEERKKIEAKNLQFNAVCKELEALKRDRKQSATSHGATEVRLNRVTEELEKMKSQLAKFKKETKESTDRDQGEIGHLRAENKRLERLRGDTMAVMKKQQKLIGVLKKQILHIEAAKLLSFTEEEFVKALDWGK